MIVLLLSLTYYQFPYVIINTRIAFEETGLCRLFTRFLTINVQLLLHLFVIAFTIYNLI